MASMEVETVAQQEAAAALVRAIRRVYGPDGIAGVEKFTVHNVHDFARRLLEQGVTVQETPAS